MKIISSVKNALKEISVIAIILGIFIFLITFLPAILEKTIFTL